MASQLTAKERDELMKENITPARVQSTQRRPKGDTGIADIYTEDKGQPPFDPDMGSARSNDLMGRAKPGAADKQQIKPVQKGKPLSFESSKEKIPLKKGGAVKKADGGILQGMKDIAVDSAHQLGEDTHRILGTEKGKKLDSQYKERENKRQQIDLVDYSDAIDRKEAAQRNRAGKNATENKKQYGMKNGGKVSSASSRGDGCAQRGKTKGRMV